MGKAATRWKKDGKKHAKSSKISSVLGGTLHHSDVDQLAELLKGTVTTCDYYGISSVGFWPCDFGPHLGTPSIHAAIQRFFLGTWINN